MSLGILLIIGERAVAASSGKLIWMSAAVNSGPANHSRRISSPSRNMKWLPICGISSVLSAPPEMARATGRIRKGTRAGSIPNTSFMKRSGISEPSA